MFKYSALTLKLLFMFCLLGLIYCSVGIFVIDPLRVYKPSNPDQTFYIGFARETMYKIIQDHPFDSVIVGSSMSENTRATEASELFNANFLNLSISAGNPHDNYILLNHILKRYEIKNVIYTIHNTIINMDNDSTEWDFLYDDSRLNDIKLYLKDKFFFCAITLNKKCHGESKNLDKPWAWDVHEYHMNRFGGFDNWLQHKDNYQIKDVFNKLLSVGELQTQPVPDTYISNMTTYLDKNIFDLAKKYPNVNFYIIIAPESDIYLSYKARHENELAKYIATLHILVNNAKHIDNIKIFGFQSIPNIGDIKNFKDLSHFHPRFNSLFLHYIHDLKYLLTTDNINQYTDQITKTAQRFNFDYYINIINHNK